MTTLSTTLDSMKRFNTNHHALLALPTLGAVLLTSSRAYAHHAMGGRMPATFEQGLLSGLAHPVIGPDHLLTLIAVGLLSLLVARGRVLGALFVSSSALGAGVHLLRVSVPFAESAVALSVVLFGALLATLAGAKSRAILLPALGATLAGLLHGYAYGESIVGAEASPLGAYFLGFTLIQLVLFALSRWAGSTASRGLGDARYALGQRLLGAAIACAGLVLFIAAARV